MSILLLLSSTLWLQLPEPPITAPKPQWIVRESPFDGRGRPRRNKFFQ